MKLYRKNFETIAAFIKNATPATAAGTSYMVGNHDARREITRNLSLYFKQECSAFDAHKFIEACGFDVAISLGHGYVPSQSMPKPATEGQPVHVGGRAPPSMCYIDGTQVNPPLQCALRITRDEGYATTMYPAKMAATLNQTLGVTPEQAQEILATVQARKA